MRYSITTLVQFEEILTLLLTDFGPIWIFLTLWMRSNSKSIIRKIRKFPLENLTFFPSKLEQMFLSL